MVPAIDAGPVLVRGEVLVCSHDDLARLSARKREEAFRVLPLLLDRLEAGAPGEAQRGAGCYHSAADRRRWTVIERPHELEVHELEHRLRSFGWLDVRIGKRLEPVTAIGARPGPGRLRLQLADGVRHVTALASHPVMPYRVARRLAGR